MTETQAYLEEAEKVIMTVLKEWRPKLLEARGTAVFELKADKSVVGSESYDLHDFSLILAHPSIHGEIAKLLSGAA